MTGDSTMDWDIHLDNQCRLELENRCSGRSDVPYYYRHSKQRLNLLSHVCASTVSCVYFICVKLEVYYFIKELWRNIAIRIPGSQRNENNTLNSGKKLNKDIIVLKFNHLTILAHPLTCDHCLSFSFFPSATFVL
jgi:hypothetical protein